MTLTRLSLTDFRNHAGADMAAAPGLVALSGDNGAGKTNILEAISLFAPGRGLRRAALSDALTAAGIAHDRDPRRGYDHGVWVPLMLAFPAADVSVVQLSLERGADARSCYLLGQALAALVR